mmetsp:Transcript_23147/g.32310  ORF Transcript_23147/g.32310 Transcript_23147/m.32310 type:complete len:149 (-) Transcript_23147:187-633(-)
MTTNNTNSETSKANVEILAGDEVPQGSQEMSQTRRGSSAVQKSPVKYVVMLPFMLFIAIISPMYRLVCNTLGDPSNLFGNFLALNSEENKILKEVPRQQQSQRKNLRQVAENQKGQRAQLDDLRKRIEKLEAKRKQHSPPSGEHSKDE